MRRKVPKEDEMLDFSLSPEQVEIQRVAREFAVREILPVAWYYDDLDEIPLFIIKKAFEAGLIGGDIPRKYGGMGFGLVEGAIAVEEVSAGCAGLATSIFDNSLGMTPVMLSDREHAKERYLGEIARDRKLICFGTSEPTMGSDVAGMRCRATKDGDGYLLDGTKYWITNGGIADYMSVFATIDPKQAHEGICAFVVDMRQEGVTVGRPIPKVGQRCSNTTGVHFSKVRVPPENVLAEPGQGFLLAMKTFDRTRPTIGSCGVGAGRSAMEMALDYTKKRRTFGSAIANYQAIQFKLAEMFMKIEAARLLTWKAAREVDLGMASNVTSSIAKLYATESAFEVANDALQIFAGYGYTRMYPIEKIFRDIRLLRIYEGTSEIQHLILAGHLYSAYQPAMPPLSELPVLRTHGGTNGFEAAQKGKAWRCPMCGFVHFGDEPPDECPFCFVQGSAFRELPRRA
ncbi:MAG TPA: acyl-CoA dehydrogenase family protein [Deltaproteobacteria bacterium]|jgi:acyl-CoA dehydrogenase|nr:acyl-CoA dehydrogenase family protein [Deltaproteobacteria bacterium]HOI08168.1 acyl-CoA dehydrogenase family protein [Deltaproteobacteria bacterium]